MKQNFPHCLEIILHHEGGFVNLKADPGGATNMGITIATYRRWKPGATVDDLKQITGAEVSKIYRESYWNRVRGDDLPHGVDLIVFDSAVNQGVARAARILQRAVGAYVDGVIGPKTLEATHGAYTGAQRQLLCEIAALRMEHYGSLSIFDTFGLGWSRRLMDVTTQAVTM